jgi:altronate hydrolase
MQPDSKEPSMAQKDASLPSTPTDALPLETVAVHLHPRDHVAIAKVDLVPGTVLTWQGADGPHQLTMHQPVASGHKLALGALAAGDAVRRYGQVIGFATRAIQPGTHVHTHNLGVGDLDRDYAFGADAVPVALAPEGERRTFLGYRRADGQVGTRNYVAVIPTANCAAHASREIARHFTAERLAETPNVDGVIALTHPYGCAVRPGGQDYVLLQRTLAGMARHPNVGAALLVGLGCEVNQAAELIKHQSLAATSCAIAAAMVNQAAELIKHQSLPSDIPCLVIQEQGGLRKTIAAGIARVEALLSQSNAVPRTPQPLSELRVALQCGGSDGWSGVTANPIVGLVADELVRQGGTVVLGETPEIYGAEHLLTCRAVSPAVGQKLIAQVRWWEDYTRRMGSHMDNNPTPGNLAGGLTTIYEKALGAVAKGGHTPLTAVYDYAAPVTARGLTFMNTPGYDPVAVTGQVAGGCQLVLFTTGRGSVFGFKPAPCIKVASHLALYQHMRDDMDLNAGQVLEGVPLADVAAELLELLIAVASGQPSKSEAQGVGEAEFAPWHLGETL